MLAIVLEYNSVPERAFIASVDTNFEISRKLVGADMSNKSIGFTDQFPEMKPVQLAAAQVHRTKGRFAFYGYLRTVYLVVWRWGLSKRRKAKELAELAYLSSRTGLQPYRVIIDATYPSLEAKMASRWTRALEYAYAKNVPPSKLVDFFSEAGGVANCARCAADSDPKKKGREKWEFWIDG